MRRLIPAACTCRPGQAVACRPTCYKTEDENGCRDSCDRPRHAHVRRLLNAIEECLDAGAVVLSLPAPDEDAPGWYGIREDLQGALWSLRICQTCVESECMSCCFSDKARAEIAARTEKLFPRTMKGEKATRKTSKRAAALVVA